MKQTLNKSQIVSLLRSDENAHWSLIACEALADYFEEYENATGEEIEFDRVAIRCEWQEYDTAKDFADYYMDPKDLEGLEESELIERIEEYMNDHTFMIKLPNDNGYLIQQF